MKPYPIRPERKGDLSSEEQAEKHLLDDELSIEDIGKLMFKDRHQRYSFYDDIIEACKAGTLQYTGDISDWQISYEDFLAWQVRYYKEKFPEKPYELLTYAEIEPFRESCINEFMCGGTGKDFYEVGHPPNMPNPPR
jgi:hypothetical protein